LKQTFLPPQHTIALPPYGLDASLPSGLAGLWLLPKAKWCTAASVAAGDMLAAATNALSLAGCKYGAASYAGELLPPPGWGALAQDVSEVQDDGCEHSIIST